MTRPAPISADRATARRGPGPADRRPEPQPQPSSSPRLTERALLTALLPLRFFVGGTFLYAGIDKFLNPAFLRDGGAGSIGQQLQAFTHASPLTPLIQAVALPHPLLIGGLMALAEIAVGLGVVLGLLYRPAAFGGFLIALLFFLTASWGTQPYYYGPDLPYAAGFLTLALVGRPGPYTLIDAVDSWFEPVPPAGYRGQRPRVEPDYSEGRRALLQAGVVGTLAVVTGGAAFAVARLFGGDDGQQGTAVLPGGGSSSGNAGNGGSSPGAVATAAGGGSGGGGQAIGSLSQINSQGAIQFSDPSSGDPAYAVQINGKVLGYDAVCTHQGCTVEYSPSQKMFGCPCHGAAFDASNSGAVLQGPARQPLRQIALRVDGQGNVFVQG